jgi:hypothetical protein
MTKHKIAASKHCADLLGSLSAIAIIAEDFFALVSIARSFWFSNSDGNVIWPSANEAGFNRRVTVLCRWLDGRSIANKIRITTWNLEWFRKGSQKTPSCAGNSALRPTERSEQPQGLRVLSA